MIKGAAQAKAMIRAKLNGISNQICEVVKDAGENIEFAAIRHAPLMVVGQIKGQYVRNEQEVSYRVMVGPTPGSYREWPVWFEFGTGVFAKNYVPSLPKEWQDTARRFYINGEGKTVEQPYLFPAWDRYSPQVPDQMAKVVKGKK